MSAQRAGGVDDATQSASEEDNGANTQDTSFENALLQEARETGHSIGDAKVDEQTEESQREESESEHEAEQTEQVSDETEEQTEGLAEAETEEETESEEAETETAEASNGKKPSIEEQIKKLEEEGQPVPWYLKRIAEQTRKGKERKETLEKLDRELLTRTAERNAALQEAKELREALESQPVASANGNAHPLLNAWNENGIQSVAANCNRFIAWAARNPEGGKYVFGKDDKGEEISRELTEDETVNMKLGAEATLRDGVPARREFLRQRAALDAQAIEVYPEFKDQNSEMSREAAMILRGVPALQLLPNIGLELGHYFRGKKAYEAEVAAKKNGKNKGTSAKLVDSARELRKKTAPVVQSRGAFVSRDKGADVATAKKNLEQRGDKESAERFLEAAGIGGVRPATATDRVK